MELLLRPHIELLAWDKEKVFRQKVGESLVKVLLGFVTWVVSLTLSGLAFI